jgi:hypothetical protein
MKRFEKDLNQALEQKNQEKIMQIILECKDKGTRSEAIIKVINNPIFPLSWREELFINDYLHNNVSYMLKFGRIDSEILLAAFNRCPALLKKHLFYELALKSDMDVSTLQGVNLDAPIFKEIMESLFIRSPNQSLAHIIRLLNQLSTQERQQIMETKSIVAAANSRIIKELQKPEWDQTLIGLMLGLGMSLYDTPEMNSPVGELLSYGNRYADKVVRLLDQGLIRLENIPNRTDYNQILWSYALENEKLTLIHGIFKRLPNWVRLGDLLSLLSKPLRSGFAVNALSKIISEHKQIVIPNTFEKCSSN